MEILLPSGCQAADLIVIVSGPNSVTTFRGRLSIEAHHVELVFTSHLACLEQDPRAIRRPTRIKPDGTQIHRAAIDGPAGAPGHTRHCAAGRAYRRPAGSDWCPVCVRGFADRCYGVASRLRSRDAEPPGFPENPGPFRNPTLND